MRKKLRVQTIKLKFFMENNFFIEINFIDTKSFLLNGWPDLNLIAEMKVKKTKEEHTSEVKLLKLRTMRYVS